MIVLMCEQTSLSKYCPCEYCHIHITLNSRSNEYKKWIGLLKGLLSVLFSKIKFLCDLGLATESGTSVSTLYCNDFISR